MRLPPFPASPDDPATDGLYTDGNPAAPAGRGRGVLVTDGISTGSGAPRHGTGFEKQGGMSPIAEALHTRFEDVCRAELQRLRRKTAALSEQHRAEIDAISVEVTQAIAARVGAALAHEGDDLAPVVARLFAVSVRANT